VTTELTTSPMTTDDLAELKATLLWTDDDTAALRRAGEILAPQVEQLLDVWYGFVGSHPFLVATFAGADGTPDARYLALVRARFAHWVIDVCRADQDQQWLDLQHELGLRHHRTKKNQTDGVDSPSREVPMRFLVAFVVPITVTVRDFLADGAKDAAELEAMMAAWFKAVTLTVALWTEPYTDSW
jgi:hypothetical protein